MLPGNNLLKGMQVLAELMTANGFSPLPLQSGRGSGGAFAASGFQRSNRRLEFHFRYSLGLVTYYLAETAMRHEDYIWAVTGSRWASHYPGFSTDPIEPFRHLLLDLEEYGSHFLTGSDDEFLRLVQVAAGLKLQKSRLP